MKRKLVDLQNECRTKEQKGPTNVADGVELSQELLCSSDVPVDVILSPQILTDPGGGATELSTELKMTKARIAKLEFVETMAARGHDELKNDVKRCPAAKLSFCEETSWENADSLINAVKVLKVDKVKMAVERNLILCRFGKHVPVRWLWFPQMRNES